MIATLRVEHRHHISAIIMCSGFLIGTVLLTDGGPTKIDFVYAKKSGHCTGNMTCPNPQPTTPPTPTPTPTPKPKCERPDSDAKSDLDKNLKTKDCDTGDANERVPTPRICADNLTNCPPPKILRLGTFGHSGSSKGGLSQIPSNATDFPGNDPSVIQVHVTSAKKDITGAYHVTGEITNVGNDTLSSVAVTAHLYDASGNLVADALGYATPINIDPGHTGTFDSLVLSDQLNGKPTSFRLSFDWS